MSLSPTECVGVRPSGSIIAASAVETAEDEVLGEEGRFRYERDSIFSGERRERFRSFAIGSFESLQRDQHLPPLAEAKFVNDSRRECGYQRQRVNARPALEEASVPARPRSDLRVGDVPFPRAREEYFVVWIEIVIEPQIELVAVDIG